MEGVVMKKERKIVIAVDESKESMHALSWCLSNLLSPNYNNKLILLYVKPSPAIYSVFDATGYMFSGDAISAIHSYNRNLVNSVMQRAEAVYKNSINNVEVERVVGTGEAKDVICSTVEKLKADTLVMGSHGYGFLKRTLLGSISDHCAKHVKCPVVIVKYPGEN